MIPSEFQPLIDAGHLRVAGDCLVCDAITEKGSPLVIRLNDDLDGPPFWEAVFDDRSWGDLQVYAGADADDMASWLEGELERWT